MSRFCKPYFLVGDKPKREPKQVMFSDGIRPGGDLTELDTAITPKPKIHSRKTGSLFGRPQRRVLEKGSPGKQKNNDKNNQIPEINRLSKF